MTGAAGAPGQTRNPVFGLSMIDLVCCRIAVKMRPEFEFPDHDRLNSRKSRAWQAVVRSLPWLPHGLAGTLWPGLVIGAAADFSGGDSREDIPRSG